MSAWVIVTYPGSAPTSLFSRRPDEVVRHAHSEGASLITVAYLPADLQDAA